MLRSSRANFPPGLTGLSIFKIFSCSLPYEESAMDQVTLRMALDEVLCVGAHQKTQFFGRAPSWIRRVIKKTACSDARRQPQELMSAIAILQ
jgi:hypothetical protein